MNTATNVSTTARKFGAATSREALRLARETLGAEAMVLSSRVLADGVEIVALAEGDASQVLARVARMTPIVASGPQALPAPAIHADRVLSELHSMRGMIEEQLASVVWNDKQRRDPVRGRLLRALLGAGFSASLSKAMLEHFPTGQSYAQGMAFVRSELIRTVPVHEDEEALLAQGGVYALMGPTGVGKTTTTAKLAARCVMRFGSDKLALVTTDSYRIGAHEQLRIYGKILNVQVYAVKDAADLHLVLQDLRDKHMVLIDTVGMSQRDRAVSDQIAMLSSSQRPVKRLLLLNATSHGDTLNEVVHAYRQGSVGNELAGCIFTKVDEATHPGALIDTVIRHRLPVHYVSNGQKVPENLMLADRAQLVDSMFQATSRSALFVPGEADLQDKPTGPEVSADVARAQVEVERLRLQYQQLIRVMAHDPQELSTTAGALAGADIGFEQARQLWRQAADDGIDHPAVLQGLMAHARSEVAAGCNAHVLALCGQVGLHSNEHGEAYELQGSMLLSDRDGLPLAAPNQWLATAATRGTLNAERKPGMRQVDWLDQQDFGKTLVHVLPRRPGADLMTQWQGQGKLWLAGAPASTAVIDPRSGSASVLALLDFDFGAERLTTFRGEATMQSEAHVDVILRSGGLTADVAEEAGAPVLRCVAVRMVDAQNRKTIAQTYLLSNIGGEVAARQLAQWQGWATEADPCFQLIKKGLQLMGGMGELGTPNMMKRLLIIGQVTTTVWRLLYASGDWAGRTRTLLTQLTGRSVQPDLPLSGNVLFEGVGKLFLLLDTLGTQPTGGALEDAQDAGAARLRRVA